MTTKTQSLNPIAPFDSAEFLTDETVIAAYLSQAMQSGDDALMLAAIGNVAKARGMTQIAKEAGLGRESLYKALSPGAKPRFDTVIKVMHALGLQIQAIVQPSR